jgi:hypothetical protein
MKLKWKMIRSQNFFDLFILKKGAFLAHQTELPFFSSRLSDCLLPRHMFDGTKHRPSHRQLVIHKLHLEIKLPEIPCLAHEFFSAFAGFNQWQQ